MNKFSCRFAAIGLFLTAIGSTQANPLDWLGGKLFGSKPSPQSAPEDIAAPGAPILLKLAEPRRFSLAENSPERELPQGKSRFQRIDLPARLPSAVLQVRLFAKPIKKGGKNTIIRPLIYVLDDGDTPRDAAKVEPLNLDIRPFKATEVTACIKLSDVEHFLVATSGDPKDPTFKSSARDKLNAPSAGGYYYGTDSVDVRLPYAPYGDIEIEVRDVAAGSKGCAALR
jgi:hypothetical protein